MIDWIWTNKEWLFSGAGVSLLGLLLYGLRHFRAKRTVPIADRAMNSETVPVAPPSSAAARVSLDALKSSTNILFIDDDVKFKVVKILENSGWKNTRIIKDVKTLDDSIVVEADILFVDVQGVGLLLGFEGQGLGLALALKEKYPRKKW